MRSFQLFLSLTATSLLLFGRTSAYRYDLRLRQDVPSQPDAQPPPLGTSVTSIRDLVTTSSIPESSTTSTIENSGSSKPAPTTGTVATTSAAETSSPNLLTTTSPSGRVLSSATPIPTSSAAATPDKNELPIQPSITPAMAVVGVILILSGSAYTLVGIKNRWMYIFLSSAYLAALSVTVLIEYVMNPPVSNAVQGAYFIAAFFTGLIFGGVSLIFTEITEALACLLGGFCLSMWFLVLKPGGLIPYSGGSRAIFIGILSVASFCLAFSHWTKSYALIVCISFAGATATVLGIDCFSRAGLKEFWLYIWNLNEDIFPLNTTTYPMTRGVKVEIAAIIIIFLAGMLSQFKLWKLLRKRKEQKLADRLQQERVLEQLEADVGRRVEDAANRDRVHWEAIYGDKGAKTARVTDSGFVSSAGSIRRGSVSIREMRRSSSGSIEMADLPITNVGSRTSLIGKRKSRDNGPPVGARIIEETTVEDSNGALESSERNPVLSTLPSLKPTTRPLLEIPGLDRAQSSTSPSPTSPVMRPQTSPGPRIVPLPFIVPTGADSDRDDADSAATSLRRKGSKRYSGASRLKKRLSLGQTLDDPGESQEDLVVPHVEDDRASSVAATMDGSPVADDDLPELSRPTSPDIAGHWNQDALVQVVAGEGHEGNTPEAIPLPLTPSTDPDFKGKEREPLTADRRSSRPSSYKTDERSRRRSKSLRSVAHSEVSEPVSISGSLLEHLPEKLSKVALTYRTNEWAKHLELAEKPDLDELDRPASPEPGVMVKQVKPEPLGPVNDDEGRVGDRAPAGDRANPMTGATRPKTRPVSGPSRLSINGSPAISRTPSSNSVTHSAGVQRSASQISMHTSSGHTTPYSSTTNLRTASKAQRSSSGPLISQTLVESPIEESEGRTISADGALAMRNTKRSSDRISSAPNVNVVAPSDAGSIRNARLDDDNISLSERRKLIKSQGKEKQPQASTHPRPTTSPQARQGSWPPPLPQQSQIHLEQLQQATFDSHQPKRSSGTVDGSKREALLASWRESVRHDLSATGQFGVANPTTLVNMGQRLPAEEDRRAAMLNEKRQAYLAQQQQQAANQYRNSMMEGMMRRGDMLDLHKEAMRRMQAAANKNA